MIRNAKGGKNREVPLPEATLNALRFYWASHRNPKFIFPARGRGNHEASTSETHMPISTVQIPLQKVLKELGIQKRVTPHTFRHSYATHLLDQGVNIRHVQFYLGHVCVETTCLYLHLTKDASEKAIKAIDELMEGFKNGEDKPDL